MAKSRTGKFLTTGWTRLRKFRSSLENCKTDIIVQGIIKARKMNMLAGLCGKVSRTPIKDSVKNKKVTFLTSNRR